MCLMSDLEDLKSGMSYHGIAVSIKGLNLRPANPDYVL